MNQNEKIKKHLSLVLEENKKTNLTRIVDEKSALLLHIEDSIAGLADLNESPQGLYGDMGSGAGYPGIPLAILSKRKTVLIDSIKKKAQALESMIRELEIDDYVNVYEGRIEELSLQKPASFSVLTARALAQLPSLLELAAPLLIHSGRLICYKSQLPNNELKKAVDLEDKIGLKLIKKREYYLSDQETKRCLVVFEKEHESKLKLPRRIGMAQKRPLSS